MTRQQLSTLGPALAADGIEKHELAVRAVAAAALRDGVSPVLCAVLADPDAPEVARLRAFGRVASILTMSERSAGAASRRAG